MVVLFIAALAVPSRVFAAARQWQVDPSKSRLVVHAYAAGALRAMLHDHHFVPERWSASTWFDPEEPGRTTVNLSVASGSLRDQQPELSQKDLRTVERQVRSEDILDAERYPWIRFRASRLEVTERGGDQQQGWLRGSLVGLLDLHGRSREIRVPIGARWSGDALRAQGRVSFRQSDFGIRPYSRFFGAVAVRDTVTVEFDLQATAR